MRHELIDNVHPAATGAVLSATLPWDHLTNFCWSVSASVVSWFMARSVLWVIQKMRGKNREDEN